jgi:hypothetical protein
MTLPAIRRCRRPAFVWANLTDIWRQAAFYVDRILKGRKPADLPAQASDQVRAGDLDAPPAVLVRADGVIE